MYSDYADQGPEDASVGGRQARRFPGAVANTILSLEQRAAALASQVKQLELQNQSTRQRQNVLSSICSVTRMGVDVAAEFDSGLAGAAASCSSVLQACSLKAVDMCVGVTLRDHPWAVQAAVGPPPRPLRWPTTADAPLAQQLADGGPLALLEHFLGLLQQHPQQFAWVQRQTPETARDMLHLIQGVIQQLLSYTHPSDANHPQPCCTSESPSVSCGDSHSGPQGRCSPAACSSSTGCSSQRAATPPGAHPAGCVEAASEQGVAAAVSAGGGRALGATLAFLEVAGLVHDALLAQQEQQQQEQQQQEQEQQAGERGPAAASVSGLAGSGQLVHSWAQAMVAAARAGRGAAGSLPGPGQAGPSCDAECALLGAVVGFIACLVVLHLSDVEFVMALGRTTCTPFPDPLVPYATAATSVTAAQLREVLWTAAFHADLRRPSWETQRDLMTQMTALMAKAAMGGYHAPDAAADAPSRMPPQQQQQQQGPGSQVDDGLGMANPDHHLLLQETSQRVAMISRVHLWYDAMQYSHIWGLLSLRQVAAFLVAVAPVTTSPVCWSLRLLQQLLEGSPWVAAAAAGSSSQAAGRRQQGAGTEQRTGVPSSEVLSWEPIPQVSVPAHLLSPTSSGSQQAQQQQPMHVPCGGEGGGASGAVSPQVMQPQQVLQQQQHQHQQQQQHQVTGVVPAAVPPGVMHVPRVPGTQHMAPFLQPPAPAQWQHVAPPPQHQEHQQQQQQQQWAQQPLAQQLPPLPQHSPLLPGDGMAGGLQGAGSPVLSTPMLQEALDACGSLWKVSPSECLSTQQAHELPFGAADEDPALLNLRADVALPENALDMAEALLLSYWAEDLA